MEPIVPVADEPMHHELWRTPTLRVLRADFPARATCLWHEHCRYTVYVSITDVDVLEHKYGCDPVPLRLARGHVLCRDHSAEPLIHRATTHDDRVVFIGVEIQPQHAPTDHTEEDQTRIDCVESVCVHRDNRSRVDRLELQKETTMILITQAEAVLVPLSDCEVLLEDVSDTSKSEVVRLQVDSAVPLLQGNYQVTVTSAENATLFVVQVFG